MTLTDTVGSLAHDAVQTAGDLKKQAITLGRDAADLGAEALSSAQHLAHSVSRNVPELRSPIAPQRSRSPWKAVALLAIIAVALAVIKNRRRTDVADSVWQPKQVDEANSTADARRSA